MCVWDDEYGISVHAKYQTTKENISEILKGFQRDENQAGYEIITVEGWDYPALMDTFEKAGKIAREQHIPVLVHVLELTQPQGHSTSGSHERYKSKERLQWESEHDCNVKFRAWIIENGIATEDELSEIDKNAKKQVREGKKNAWDAFITPIKQEKNTLVTLLQSIIDDSSNKVFINKIKNDLIVIDEPTRKDIMSAARKTLRYTLREDITAVLN